MNERQVGYLLAVTVVAVLVLWITTVQTIEAH